MARIHTIGGIFRQVGREEAIDFLAGYIDERVRDYDARGYSVSDIEHELDARSAVDICYVSARVGYAKDAYGNLAFERQPLTRLAVRKYNAMYHE